MKRITKQKRQAAYAAIAGEVRRLREQRGSKPVTRSTPVKPESVANGPK